MSVNRRTITLALAMLFKTVHRFLRYNNTPFLAAKSAKCMVLAAHFCNVCVGRKRRRKLGNV